MTRTTSYPDGTDFAWVITKDHLYEGAENGTFSNETGEMGPSEAPDELVEMLDSYMTQEKYTTRTKTGKRVKWLTFRMYDDDGILYYTGRLLTYADQPSEEALYAPLADFGGPSAGAVLIKYDNHPEWTMEY